MIRTDEIRKRLCGVSALDRLGPEGYSPEMSMRVYASAAERARATIREGHSAIVDAVFARLTDREDVERVAEEMSVPFVGIWLEAPESMLIARTEKRRNDPSDADASVIRMQHRQQAGMMTWHRVKASTSPETVLEYATKYVQQQVHGALNSQGVRANAS